MIMPSISKKMPIKTKLILVVFLTSLAVLLLENIAFIIYERIHQKEDLVQNINSFARIISTRSATPLAQRNKNTVQEILNIAGIENQIVAACIYNLQGEIFTRYDSGEERAFEFPAAENLPLVPQIEDDYLYLSEPIMENGVPVGNVFIRASLRELNLRWCNFLLYRGLMILLVSSVTLLIVFRLQRIVLRPIERLNAMVHAIVVNQNYRMRVDVEGNDVISSLAHAFNNTFEAIESRDNALHHCHERLADFEQKIDYPADLLALASLHIADGIEHNGGNINAYRKQLRRFRQHFANATSELHRIVFDEQDMLSAIVYCDALKGVSGNIGAVSLFRFSTTLANELHQGNSLNENDFERLDSLLRNVFQDIDSLDIEQVEHPPEKRNVSPSQLAAITKELLITLEQDLGESEKLLTQLCELAEGSEFEPITEAIAVQLDEFNVEQATFLLMDLQQRLLTKS